MAVKPLFVPPATPSPAASLPPIKANPFKPAAVSLAKALGIKPLWQPPPQGTPPPLFVPLSTGKPLFVSGSNPETKLATAFLRNLAYDVTEKDLQDLLEPFKASHVRIIRDKDTNMPKGYAFCDFPDDAALQAAMLGIQGAALRGRPLQICVAEEGQKGESMVNSSPLWRATAPPPDIPKSFIEDMMSQMKSCSGTNGQECRFGRGCKQLNCMYTHSNGREIENAPSSMICWFRRKCKSADCFFVHPSGREIDEDSSKGFCSVGAACDNPDCACVHPDTRTIVSKARCGVHGNHENTKYGGPVHDSLQVQATELPEEWISEGREALAMRIQGVLEGCGHFLAAPPEVAADCKSAIATFVEPAHAKQAVAALTDMHFRVELHASKPDQQWRWAERNEECCVFVGNIAGTVTHEDLLEFFSKVGIVDSFNLVRDKMTQEHKGFGFCYFFDVMTAEAAILTLDGKELQGKRLRVSAYQKETGEVTTSCIQVWGYPKEWSEWTPADILAELGIELEVVDKLELPPTMEESGSRMIAKYKDCETAKRTVEVLSGSSLSFQVALYFAPQKKKIWTPEGGGTGKKESTIFVGNLSYETTEEDMQEAFSFNDALVSIRLVRDKNTDEPKGYGFIEFTDAAAAGDALRRMRDCEINGRKIRLARAEEPLGQTRNRSRSSKRRRREWDGDEKEQIVCIHVDELALHARPRVDPCPDDCEIWVDPLPDDGDTDEWLRTFGEVAEVFRVPNIETGSPSDRGYVRFADHASAVKAVEAQVAQWSESERIITSQRSSKRGNHSTYPFSVVSFIIGPGGKNLHGIRDDIGASMLVLRGEGLNPSGGQQHKVDSSRAHFICKGSPDALSRVQPALEAALVLIHHDITERLEEPSSQPQSQPARRPPSPPPPPIRQPHPDVPEPPPLPKACVSWPTSPFAPPPADFGPLPAAFALPSRVALALQKPSLATTRKPSRKLRTWDEVAPLELSNKEETAPSSPPHETRESPARAAKSPERKRPWVQVKSPERKRPWVQVKSPERKRPWVQVKSPERKRAWKPSNKGWEDQYENKSNKEWEDQYDSKRESSNEEWEDQYDDKSTKEWEDQYENKYEKRVAAYPRLHAGTTKHAGDVTWEKNERRPENKFGKDRRSKH